MVSAATAIESPGSAQERPAFSQIFNLPVRSGQRSDRPREAQADPVELQLSPEAQAALAQASGAQPPAVQAFDRALAQNLPGLGREAMKVFTLLGLSPAAAGQAASSLAGAIRDATRWPPVPAQIVAMTASERSIGDGSTYRASVIIEQAAVVWDPVIEQFVTSLKRVTLSVGVDSNYIVPRGAKRASGAGDQPVAEIRIDAAVPVRFSIEENGPGREATGPAG